MIPRLICGWSKKSVPAGETLTRSWSGPDSQKVLSRLSRKLDLDAGQQEKVEAIVEARHGEIRVRCDRRGPVSRKPERRCTATS